MLRAFSNWNQTNWVSLLLMIQLAIKNQIASATEISLFFLLYSYELNTIQMKLSQIKKNPNRKSSKFQMNAVMSKMRDAMEFAQTAMINTQQKQKCQTNHHHQKSSQLHINDKVWLAIKKQYSIRKPSWKLNYKNQKYTVTEVVSPHAVHFNIKDIHPIFYVNQLCLTANNPLPSQSQPDDQPAPIHMKGEKEWYINEIIAEKLHCHDHDIMKWFQIKYTNYAIPEWNQVMNMKDTATLKWWMKHTKKFQNAHSRLPDGFQCESHPRQTLWHRAWEQGGIVMG